MIRKIAVEILQSVNNRRQSLREIVYYAWVLFSYIVINTLLGRVTLDPAGMHWPARDDAFVSSFFFVCHAPSPERRAFEVCVVRTHIALPFIGRFRRFLQRFFRKGLHFQTRSHSSLGGATIFAKLRSKIAKSPKIGGNVCAHQFVYIVRTRIALPFIGRFRRGLQRFFHKR